MKCTWFIIWNVRFVCLERKWDFKVAIFLLPDTFLHLRQKEKVFLGNQLVICGVLDEIRLKSLNYVDRIDSLDLPFTCKVHFLILLKVA